MISNHVSLSTKRAPSTAAAAAAKSHKCHDDDDNRLLLLSVFIPKRIILWNMDFQVPIVYALLHIFSKVLTCFGIIILRTAKFIMYQAISEENNQSVTYLEVEGRHHGPDEAPKNWKRTAIVWWFTFVVTVVFYSFCIFQTFSPITFRMSEGDYIRGNRHLTEEPSCTVQKAGTEIAVGGIAGVVLVTGAVILIGLTPAGPVAGGLFASNMGAGLAAGSLMSAMQSAVMTGSIYSMGLAIGATAGASTAAATCAQR